MKYHLETIPVWDAYKKDSECPLCDLEHNTENQYVDFFMGESIMEPDVRIKVNQTGFCKSHYRMLYSKEHKLGLALMTQTHFSELLKNLKDSTKSPILKGIKFPFTKMQRDNKLEEIHDTLKSCVICDMLEDTMNRYIFTIIYLWKKDNEFKNALNNSKGFCISHFIDIINMAQTESAEFIKCITELELKNLERLNGELKWFIDKFDYRNQDKPWGASKDALPRTINKIMGKIIDN